MKGKISKKLESILNDPESRKQFQEALIESANTKNGEAQKVTIQNEELSIQSLFNSITISSEKK